MLRRLADQPGERDQRRRGEHEDGQLSGGAEPVQHDDERPEHEQRPQRPPGDGARSHSPASYPISARRVKRPSPSWLDGCGAVRALEQSHDLLVAGLAEDVVGLSNCLEVRGLDQAHDVVGTLGEP